MKKLQFIFPVVVLVTIVENLQSQSFTPALSIPVTVNGNQIINPWAGGLNSPQFSEIDLNGDGIKDLFVFDPFLPGRITTFINTGTPNQVDYHYAPQYISKFPPGMHNWVLLVDYNCDGKEDIFTHTYLGGVSVYKNVSVAGNLQFVLEYPLIYSNYFGFTANLFVAAMNLPALTDIDGDNDLDMLVPSIAGYSIEFHKNYSIENFGICDSLVFVLDTLNTSWGGWGTFSSNQGRTLLAFDNDNDGDKDLLTFNDNFNYFLSYFENTGTPQAANLILVDDSFPSYNIPARVSYYPACFYSDVNNDTKKDLLVSPFVLGVENIKNVQFYENLASTGTNNFNLTNHNFLVDNMIDAGEGSQCKIF